MPRLELIERNQSPRKDRQMPIVDVVRFESGDKYVTVHALDRSIVLKDSLTALEHEFSERFFRAHVSHLVEVSRITRIEGKRRQRLYVQLRDVPERVPLGRRQLRALLERRPDLARR